MNIQGWLPLEWTGLISLRSKGLSGAFSNTTVGKHWLSVLSLLCGPTLTWRITALPYCVGLCHTSVGISRRYTYAPFLLNLSPTSHAIPPFRLILEFLNCGSTESWESLSLLKKAEWDQMTKENYENFKIGFNHHEKKLNYLTRYKG